VIVLDTNVLSETMRPLPDDAVIAWLNAQPFEDLYFPAICLAEVATGVAVLPAGKRKAQLQRHLQQATALFGPRVLAFDTAAAAAFAEVRGRCLKRGHDIGFADCAIAAIAHAHNAQLATRNTKDFLATGVKLIDPWLSSRLR
jgi:toxin FitB